MTALPTGTELASEFETTADNFACFLEGLSPQQWSRIVPGEERTVVALARHVGWGFGYEMIAFRAFAEGRPFEAITRSQLDALNATNGAE